MVQIHWKFFKDKQQIFAFQTRGSEVLTQNCISCAAQALHLKDKNTCLHNRILTGSGAQILQCMASEEAQEEAHGHQDRFSHHSLQQSEKKKEKKTKIAETTQPAASQDTSWSQHTLSIVLRSVSFYNVLLSPAWQSSEITPNVTVC